MTGSPNPKPPKMGRTRRIAAAIGLAVSIAISTVATAGQRALDHVYLIVLENHSFDDALFGPTPFLRHLAQTQGLATYYFGVAHPSLPNYLAMVAGDDFGVRDDSPSCFAEDRYKATPCHGFDSETIVDQLERKGLTWAYYGEDLPRPGSLAIAAPNEEALYAQKHNPFAYFRRIATSASRRNKMKPLGSLRDDLASAPPNFSFIVPNQCNDGHGLASCQDQTELDKKLDRFVAETVDMIRGSKFWSNRSAIIITFDEGVPPRGVSGGPASVGCCGPDGGHHIATLVVTKCGAPKRSARTTNHYSLLATLEDGFGLPRLAKAARAQTMWDLFGSACRR
jgi:phosphatidylinositol-3-phosphatase